MRWLLESALVLGLMVEVLHSLVSGIIEFGSAG
jgi:hypothetical protein